MQIERTSPLLPAVVYAAKSTEDNRGSIPGEGSAGQAHQLAGSHYWIEPVVREAALAGCGEKVRALLLRKPLEQAKSSQERGSPCCYLFGAIPVAVDR